MPPDRMSFQPSDFRGIDLFPDVQEEIDRSVLHAEQRVKFWVMAGVAANLLVAILAAIPLIFYMGQVSRDISQQSQQITILTAQIKEHETRLQDMIIWRAEVEARSNERNHVQ